MVKSAIELADITTEDPHAGLPDPEELGSIPGDLGLYSPDVARTRDRREDRDAPGAPRRPRFRPTRASSTPKARPSTRHVGRHVFANSRGFAGEYRTSYCSLSAVPVARDGESMERDYWYTMARGFARPGAARRCGPHGRRSAPCGA